MARLETIVHVATIATDGSHISYLFLCQTNTGYHWVHDDRLTGIEASTLPRAFFLGAKAWRHDAFTLLWCGFVYTLPTRDEVGAPALFRQMVASYSSSSGVYYDAELGHLCWVEFASQEALSLWHELDINQTAPPSS